MADTQTKRRAIVRVPGILSEEPIVEGTRIVVRTVVLLYSALDRDPQRVREELPTLQSGDVETAIRYYRTHREEINRHIAENTEGEDIPYDELGR